MLTEFSENEDIEEQPLNPSQSQDVEQNLDSIQISNQRYDG